MTWGWRRPLICEKYGKLLNETNNASTHVYPYTNLKKSRLFCRQFTLHHLSEQTKLVGAFAWYGKQGELSIILV